MTVTMIETPVLIVGGGGCGLTLSSILSNYGIEHTLIEKHDSTSRLPKAHYLNQRSMEVFRKHDLVDEIIELGTPARYMSKVAWVSSLGGDGPLDQKVIHTIPSFGQDVTSEVYKYYSRDAPQRSGNLPQMRLEPVLRRLAEVKNPGRILYGHTLVDFADDGNVVLAKVVQPCGKEVTYRTKYLVGADGGKFVGAKIGVEMSGPSGVADMISVHFTADLSEYWDDRNFLCFFINGSGKTALESGVIVPQGPTWGRHSEGWVFHFGYDHADEERFDDEKIISRVHEILKIPNLEMKVHKVSHWNLERVLANKFSEGRVFVAGDAAHRHPPNTGLGLNTAVEDANNLGWKLALVLKGQVGEDLLQTYDLERRYAGKRNCDWAFFTFTNSVIINAAIGFESGAEEVNKQRFIDLLEDGHVAAARRQLLKQCIEMQGIEFGAHDLELGFNYIEGCLIPDGTDAPVSDPKGQFYTPTTCPGHRLPHTWVEHQGKMISTHDIIERDSAFLVITDDKSNDWVSAATRFGEKTGVKIQVAVIGDRPSFDYFDGDEQWKEVKRMDAGGAILVRLDNFVAWRAMGASKAGGAELEEALEYLVAGKHLVMTAKATLSSFHRL